MFSDPIKNLKQLGLRENMIVADLGAGSGFYTIPAAKIVTSGKVYAIEIQKDFLVTIQNKVKEAGLNNVECFLGDIEIKGGTKIKDNIVDVVIASNVLFQVENKDRFVKEIERILKPDGIILLIDWSENSSVKFPSEKMIVSKDEAKEIFFEKGFIFERDIDAGINHYGMILRREK